MRCPNCQTPTGSPDWKAKETSLWANQHGYKVRIFCGACGQWTDYVHRYSPEYGKFYVVHPPNKIPQEAE